MLLLLYFYATMSLLYLSLSLTLFLLSADTRASGSHDSNGALAQLEPRDSRFHTIVIEQSVHFAFV